MARATRTESANHAAAESMWCRPDTFAQRTISTTKMDDACIDPSRSEGLRPSLDRKPCQVLQRGSAVPASRRSDRVSRVEAVVHPIAVRVGAIAVRIEIIGRVIGRRRKAGRGKLV